MQVTDFSIHSIISEILRNGTKDNINKNTDVLSFILGALDCGFSVKFNGYLPHAKYSKIEVFLKWERDNDNLNIVIFKGKEKQGEFKYGYGNFLWLYSSVTKGRFCTKIEGHKQFICSTN